MTDKQINTCEFLNICETNCSGTLEDTEVCHCYELYKQLKRKEQECKNAQSELIEANKQVIYLAKQLQRKEQECDRLKWYLKEIRYQELSNLDIDYDEYETNCVDTEYTNIISLVEEALNERNSEDYRDAK